MRLQYQMDIPASKTWSNVRISKRASWRLLANCEACIHGKQVASQMQKMMSLRSLLRPWRSQMLRLLYACMSCKFANVSRDPHEFGKNGSLVTTLVSGM